MKEIDLNKLKLKTFSEQDVLDYCQINNINPDNITELDLGNNKLTDISGIKLFKNLKYLYLWCNNITDITVLKDLNKLEYLWLDNSKIKNISVIQYLKNLKGLYIQKLRLESDQVQYINNLKNLKTLFCYNGFKDMSVLKQINKKIKIY